MIAKRIPTILPEMEEDEALEVTKIYSVCGLLKKRGALITRRPFIYNAIKNLHAAVHVLDVSTETWTTGCRMI